jgi:serine/threonine protein kinase
MQMTGGPLERGSVVAGYRIDETIGRGGMGVVYRATHVALNRVYALKVLAPTLAADEGFRQRFRREMQIAASLHHPNVVGTHYAGEHEGALFFVMDFVAGTDLREVIQKSGALEPNRASELTVQVASALDAAHGRGLVHRDVKPANILLTVRDGEEHSYLTDFGLAKKYDTVTGVAGLTAMGAVVGTVDYMAPEQITGGHTDARTDIYALGCVFFQMLTGDVPYERENSVATLFAHVHAPPPPLTGTLADLYPTFGGVIEKAMAKDPDDRYLSAGDFARDISASLSGMRYSGPPTVTATGEATPLPSRRDPIEPAPAVVASGETAPPPSRQDVVAPAPPTVIASSEATPMPVPGPDTVEPAHPTSVPAQPPPGATVAPAGLESAPAFGGATIPPTGPEPGAASMVPPAAAFPGPGGQWPGGQWPGGQGPGGQGPGGQGPGGQGPGGPDPPGRRPGRSRLLALAVLVLGGAIAAVIVLTSSSSSSGATFAAVEAPIPLNNVSGSGSATVQLQGNVATVTVDTNRLLSANHLMHIHGGSGTCPSASVGSVLNGHRFISAKDGDRSYGGVVTSLTDSGDTSPVSHLSRPRFPSVGNIRYKRSIPLGPGVANLIRQGEAVIVVHGIDYNGNRRYDSSLGLDGEAAAPALCGSLAATRTATARQPSAPTVYTASLGVYGRSPAEDSAGLTLLCHVGSTAVTRPTVAAG